MTQNGRILLIDDDPDFSASLEQLLMLEDYVLEVFRSPEQALAELSPEFSGIVMSDVAFRRMPGQAVLDRIAKSGCKAPYVVLSGPENIAAADRLRQAGAFGVLSKPIQIDALLTTVGNALQSLPTAQVTPAAQTPPTSAAGGLAPTPGSSPADGPEFMGNSRPITAIREQIPLIAERNRDFLSLGEVGTGKEHLARCIAAASDRAAGPFVVVDCADLSPETADVDLFGQSETLLTPAKTSTESQLDRARGGVLYLKNIEALPTSAQKTLMVLIKGRQALADAGMGAGALDFRLAAGSAADLAGLAATGRFDPELFTHIKAITINMPAVRDRGVDAVILFDHFLKQAMAEHGLPKTDVSASLTHYIISHNWPGNVDELRTAADTFAKATKKAVDDATSDESSDDTPAEAPAGRSVIEFRKILGN